MRAAEADVAAGVTSCSLSGSVVDWVEDWIQDSVIIDIGADATVWNSVVLMQSAYCGCIF